MSLPALQELIPHRAPMSLLDRIRCFEEPTIQCELSIRADSMFLRAGKVHAVVTLEYMAQAGAAYSGLVLCNRGKSARVGFLVSVPTFELSASHLLVGDQLLVHATVVYKGSATAAFDCKVEREGQTIAAARVIVMSKETQL